MPDMELGPVDGGSAALRAYLATPVRHRPVARSRRDPRGLRSRRHHPPAGRPAGRGRLPDPRTGPVQRRRDAPLRVEHAAGAVRRRSGKPIADIEAARAYLLAGHERLHRQGRDHRVLHGRRFRTRRPPIPASTRRRRPTTATARRMRRRRWLAVQLPDRRQLRREGRLAARRRRVRCRNSRSPGSTSLTNDVKEYPTAGHSFLNDRLLRPPSFTHPVQRITHLGPGSGRGSKDAWDRIEAFFGEHLAAT